MQRDELDSYWGVCRSGVSGSKESRPERNRLIRGAHLRKCDCLLENRSLGKVVEGSRHFIEHRRPAQLEDLT